MSFEAMTWAVKFDLPVKEKITLLMLANRSNPDDGMCVPSIDRLAKDCGMSKSSVKRALASLVERGLVDVIHRTNGTANISNAYRLNLSEIGGVGSHRTEGGFTQNRGVGSHRTPKQREETENRNREDESDLFSAEEEPQKQDRTSEVFDRFWKEYPKKAGKPAALKAFTKAIKKTDPEIIISGARRYAAWLKSAKPGEFRPTAKHPQGWLNDERWNDEEIKPAAKPMSYAQQVLADYGVRA